MGTFGIQAALNQMDQACESINKAMCAIDSFRQRPDIKLLDIAVDYLKEAGGSICSRQISSSPCTSMSGSYRQTVCGNHKE